MSVVKETLIFCDGSKGGLLANDFACPMDGPYGDGDSRSRTAASQRDGYKLDGWRFINGKDYCPACVARRNSVKGTKTP